jgi:cytochrome c oxidase subunit 6c
MSAKAVATLAKPKMRGLLTDQIKKNLVISTVLSFGAMFAYKFLVADKRKIAYAEFYRYLLQSFVITAIFITIIFFFNSEHTTLRRSTTG